MNGRRDAAELTPDEVSMEPVVVQHYPLRQAPGVVLQLAGGPHFGSALERRDYADGRIAFRLVHQLAQGAAEPLARPRVAWVWGDVAAMAFSALEPNPIEDMVQPGDAIRYRSTALGDSAPAPVYEPYGARPVTPVRIRIAGQWRPARATWRVRDPRGVRVITRITLEDRGWPMEHHRAYWWDPAAIQPA